jgi:flagellar hook assembly protein FlgD
LRFAVVHHTAGTNSYTAAESAAIVRGIQRYHVLANGWNDIGYNFLVDKYGQVFEGRGGGIDKNVVGAHAQGFNTGSTGVSILGTYSSSPISSAARSALVRLLAWRLDVAHVDPLAGLTWISGGNPQYPAGTPVKLRTIAGHRNTGPTSCPGDALYAQLPGIRASVAASGGPKLYDPEVSGSLGGPVHVTGRLSESLAWTVTIKASADGSTVAAGTGTGTKVDWIWDATAYPAGAYTYTIEAGSGVRPWTARVPGPPPLALERLRASPRVVTPNGDGSGESTSISFFLTANASVTADVVDASGTMVRRLANARALAAGTRHLRWDGRDGAGSLVPDGVYSLELTAASPGQSDSSSRAIVVDRTLGFLNVTPPDFSPNGDGRLDTVGVTFTLARGATVRVLVLHGDTRIATLEPATDLLSGLKSFTWDGKNRYGALARDRAYRIRVEATTSLGTRRLSKPVELDTVAPRARIVGAWTGGRRTTATITLSESALLKIWFGTSRVVLLNATAGTHVVSKAGAFRVVQARAWDAAENPSGIARARVRRR